MGTRMPVSSRKRRKRLRMASRSVGDEPGGTGSSSWKLTPCAELGEVVDGVDEIERRPNLVAEGIAVRLPTV